MKFSVLPFKSRFGPREDGYVLTETLFVIPILVVFSIGTLEFGNFLWQRQQVQTGVRDAARYWARCKPTFNACSITRAQNIAVYGNPAGTGQARVPGWTISDVTITPATPPAGPTAADVVTATASVDYANSPLYSALKIGAMTINATHQQRYLGW